MEQQQEEELGRGPVGRPHPWRLADAGPVLLLLPLLAGALAVVHLLTSRGAGGPPLDVGRSGAASVPGWEGALDLPDGARLTARLTPLFVDDGRQAFDAEALRARWPELGAGAPYRLELDLEGERAALDLTDLTAGADLAPLAGRLAGREPGAASDPLRTLLAPPPGDLAAGARRQLVLWGTPGEEAPALRVDGLRVPLAAAAVPLDALPRSLARVESPADEPEVR